MKRLTRYFNSGKLCLADWSEQEAINKLGELEDVVEELDRLRNQLELSQIENMQLKQAQKQLAISELEKVKTKFNSKRPIDELASEVGIELGYTSTQINNFVENKIKELESK